MKHCKQIISNKLFCSLKYIMTWQKKNGSTLPLRCNNSLDKTLKFEVSICTGGGMKQKYVVMGIGIIVRMVVSMGTSAILEACSAPLPTTLELRQLLMELFVGVLSQRKPWILQGWIGCSIYGCGCPHICYLIGGCTGHNTHGHIRPSPHQSICLHICHRYHLHSPSQCHNLPHHHLRSILPDPNHEHTFLHYLQYHSSPTMLALLRPSNNSHSSRL